MRLSQFVSFAVLLVTAGFSLADEEKPSDVLSLTPDNFSSVVDKENLMLVEFFAPWCGHCKALAPHYEDAATTLKEKNIKLAKVDCVDQAELCRDHGVQGYPTLKVFRNGESTDYSGPRKADGIISYMIKQSLPAVVEVTAANHDEIKTADKLVLIAYVSSTDTAPGPAFSVAAENHRDDYLFGLTTDEEVIKAAGVTPPALVLYRNFDEPRIDFTSHVASASPEELVAFIKDHSVPVLDEVNAESYQTYANSGLPLAYVFLEPTDENNEEFLASLRPVAKKFAGKVNFVWIDAVKYAEHAKALNLRDPKWPSFVVQDISKQLKYPLSQEEDVTPKTVETLVEDYLSGKIEASLKSEPIPSSQDEPVYVVVGKTFEEVVFDDSKDVFIEFYAPWCGHCKRLKPTWDSLGERYADVKDQLIIAKMDATENDLPSNIGFQIKGFPTLKFKPAGSREFLEHSGDRSLESLIEFVEEKAKNSLEPQKAPKEAVKVEEVEQIPLAVEHHDEL